MVYIQSWQEYQDAAETLYLKSPSTTRYCVKWRGVEGKLVLKITDNEQCIKFKTYSAVFLNRFEALNLSLMQKMQNRKPPPPPVPSISSQAAAPSGEAMSSIVPSGSTPAASGGVKKKKPKKKK